MAGRPDDSADRLLGQLEWMADEIEAQRPFIARLPEVQLTAAPVAGESSIRQYYEDLLRRELERHLPVVREFAEASGSLDASGPDECDSVDDILSALVESRRRLIDILRTIDPADWTETLETFLYEAALSDGDVLRRIGERLYESELRLTDPDQVPNPGPDA